MTDDEMDAYGRRHDGTSNAMNDIWRERIRQMNSEGYSPAHDDGHPGEMAKAGAVYALRAGLVVSARSVPLPLGGLLAMWPWEEAAYKPKDPRRDLIRAAALIVAEIERIDRQAQPSGSEVPARRGR